MRQGLLRCARTAMCTQGARWLQWQWQQQRRTPCLGVILGVAGMQCDVLELQAAAQVDRGDDVLQLWDDARRVLGAVYNRRLLWRRGGSRRWPRATAAGRTHAGRNRAAQRAVGLAADAAAAAALYTACGVSVGVHGMEALIKYYRQSATVKHQKTSHSSQGQARSSRSYCCCPRASRVCREACLEGLCA